MSVLDDIINQEQLAISNYFSIELGDWNKYLRTTVVDKMHDWILRQLEEYYEGADFMNEDYFPTICNDVPGLIGDYLYGMGYITKASRDNIALSSLRDAPFWGVPEVPQFSLPIRMQFNEEHAWICIHVSNLIWENRWKGVDPVAYDKFIHYMHSKWRSPLPFCHNANPWKVLEDILTNQNKYNEYGNTL